jgi:hypothetical protein
MSRHDQVTDMFLVFGAANPERVAAFVHNTKDQTCETCYELTCSNIAKHGTRAPVPGQFHDQYRAMFEAEHFKHVGYNAKQAATAKAEAFWRHMVHQEIEAATKDRPMAGFIAAQMWWSRVEQNPDVVRDEILNHRIWIRGVDHFLKKYDTKLTQELIDKAWHRARKASTEGEDALTDEERNLGLQPDFSETKAMRKVLA